MTLALRWAGRSEVGPVREGNEDSAYAGPRLALIADGVGGMIAGEVASSLALRAMHRLDEDTADDVVDALGTALDNANTRLREAVAADPALEGMGTTMTALLWNGAQLGLVHVGDSRAYLLRDGRLQQVTTDHTFVQTLVDEGRITREQARSHPHRSLILQALDGRTHVEPDLTRLELLVGDRFLLCSDGLSDVLRDDAITTRLSVPDPQAAADDLVGAALAGGGTDNITCVVVDAVEVDAAGTVAGAGATGAGDPGASTGHVGAPAAEPLLLGAAADPEVGGLVRRLAAGGTTDPTHHPYGSSVAGGRGDGRGPGGGTRGRAAAGGVAPGEHGGTAAGRDPEDVRYAPRAPHRLRWVARSLAVVGVLALVLAGGRSAYGWTQTQYYVTANAGRVAIYRGIPQHVPGLTLSHLYSVSSDISVDDLPENYRGRIVGDTLPADTVAQAQAIVANLAGLALRCAPTPPATATPTPTATPISTSAPSVPGATVPAQVAAPTAPVAQPLTTGPPTTPPPTTPPPTTAPLTTPPPTTPPPTTATRTAAPNRTGCGGGLDLASPTPSPSTTAVVTR